MQDNDGSSSYPDAPGDTDETSRSASSSQDRYAGPSSGGEAISGQAKEFLSQASDHALGLIDQIKDKAGAAAEGQRAGIADAVDGLADTVRKSGEPFKGQQDWIAGAVERGASELSNLATALRENDLATLVRQVQGIAREQPALFIGASFAAGFALARFGKVVASDLSREDLPTLPEISRGER